MSKSQYILALTSLLTACSDGAVSGGPGEESSPSAMQPGEMDPDDDGAAQPTQPGVVPGEPPGSSTGGGSGSPGDPPTNGSSVVPGVTTPGTQPTTPGAPSNPPNPGEPPVTTPVDPVVPGETFVQCDTPGPRLIRRLTAQQYENTLVSLLGDGFSKEVVFSDPAINGFHVDADAIVVSDLTSELLMNYAEQAAAWVIQNQKWKIASCGSHDATCHRQAITEFGRRAFRQDLTEEQIATYLPLLAAEESLDAGLHVLVSTMLQSPYLLYRRELGEPDAAVPGTVRLTPYEFASQLAYFLTDAPPDDQLLAAAAEGRLSTKDEIDQQVYGLFSRDTGKAALARFVHGWLEVDNLPKKAKDATLLDLNDALRTAMLAETRQFFLDLFDTGGTIADLFGAEFTHVNQPLAELYGFGGVGGDAFSRVALEGRRATGVLGQGAFLTEHSLPDNSSPVQRGVIVRERILCQDLPPVPENLDTNLSEPAGFASNRERYTQHSADPNCVGCHALIDPVGFAFENYDAFGRYRTEEMGTAVDASGSLTGVEGGPIPLDGLQSLNDYLATSVEARSCFIRFWSYYAYGKQGWAEEQCNHDAIRAAASADDYSLKSTLLAIVHSPHFTRRVAD